MEQLYEKYKNIQLFATKYRNYTLVNDKFYDYDTFKNKMYGYEYILHKFNNPKTPGKTIDLYLFKHDSKYIDKTTYFKKILERYNTESTIIMITKEELNAYRKKMISLHTNITLKNYLYKHFIMEINKGPLCSVHSIMTPEEIQTVSYNIMAHAHKLPAIFENDPQNIWIGGEINDLIKIESYSEITGKIITYRLVTPSTGKIAQVAGAISKKSKKQTKKNTNIDNDAESNDGDNDAESITNDNESIADDNIDNGNVEVNEEYDDSEDE